MVGYIEEKHMQFLNKVLMVLLSGVMLIGFSFSNVLEIRAEEIDGVSEETTEAVENVQQKKEQKKQNSQRMNLLQKQTLLKRQKWRGL